MLYLYIRKTLCSKYFLLSVLCGLAAHAMNLSAWIPQIIAGQMDAVYCYDYSIGFGSFGFLFVLAPAVSCGLSFWEEVNPPFFRLIVTRDAKIDYLKSRISGSMLVGALSSIAVFVACFVLLRFFIPIAQNTAERLYDLRHDNHAYLWRSAYPWRFLLFFGILAGLHGMLWGMVSLIASTFTENRFVILACPILISQTLDIVLTLMNAPNAIQPYHLMTGYFVLGNSMLRELGWVFIIYSFYLLPLIVVFFKRAWRIVYE